MTSRLPAARMRNVFATALLAVAVLTATGCSSEKELIAMPTLVDVTPVGPKGQKCFEHCAQAEVSCRHMCPKSEGLCQQDCVLDTKYCLYDCPELRNNNPDKFWPAK